MSDAFEVPLACDLTAFTPEQRARHDGLWERLVEVRLAVREVADGYAFQYPGDAEMCMTAAEFMTLEHICCPFFRMTLEIEPGKGTVWMHWTGSETIKQFLKAEMELDQL